MLNIAFRADSSYQIGIGHIMRCLTLALVIKKQHQVTISFFCRKTEGNINNLILAHGFKVMQMQAPKQSIHETLTHSSWLGATQQQDVCEFIKLSNKEYFDLIITDHYAIDQIWHKQIATQTKKIMVIDDLADRIHQCDYLLDQTFNCSPAKYNKLVPTNCIQMLGTKYALLRDEFQQQKKKQKTNNRANLLVMFGGSDPDNLTLQALNQLVKRSDIDKITIILANSALHIDSVSQFLDKQKNTLNLDLKINPTNIAALMSQADLAIGAAGTTSWERCTIGLPAVVIIQAENQREIANELSNKQVISYIESFEIETLLNKQIDQWLNNPSRLKVSIVNGQEICDGYGAYRVSNRILKNEA